MSNTVGINRRIGALQKKIGLSLIFSWLLPWILYMVLRPYFASDTTTLAIVGIFPLVRTIAQFLSSRRVDWISAGGVLSFTIALTFSFLLGGSSLPFKLSRPALTGIIGLAFLISAVIRKPLILTIIKALKHKVPEGLSNSMPDSGFTPKKMTIITAVAGLLLLGDAVTHIIMAISLPTGTFLLMSRVVTIAVVVILLGFRWIVGRSGLRH